MQWEGGCSRDKLSDRDKILKALSNVIMKELSKLKMSFIKLCNVLFLPNNISLIWKYRMGWKLVRKSLRVFWKAGKTDSTKKSERRKLSAGKVEEKKKGKTKKNCDTDLLHVFWGCHCSSGDPEEKTDCMVTVVLGNQAKPPLTSTQSIRKKRTWFPLHVSFIFCFFLFTFNHSYT